MHLLASHGTRHAQFPTFETSGFCRHAHAVWRGCGSCWRTSAACTATSSRTSCTSHVTWAITLIGQLTLTPSRSVLMWHWSAAAFRQLGAPAALRLQRVVFAVCVMVWHVAHADMRVGCARTHALCCGSCARAAPLLSSSTRLKHQNLLLYPCCSGPRWCW